jgi:hypothetical protein
MKANAEKMRKRGMQKLQTAEMRFLRYVNGYTGLGNIRKDNINKELGVFSLNARIIRYIQNWFEHVERMEEGRVLRHGPSCRPEGRSDLGRQCRR